MACILEDKYPLTYGKMKELYLKKAGFKTEPYLLCFSRKVDKTELKLQQDFNEYLVEVQRPIWNIAEDLLFGRYEIEFEEGKQDTFTLMVADQEIKGSTTYHMNKETVMSPDVTNNIIEYNLLVSIIHGVIHYERHGQYRKAFLDFYKEK
tara:strand:- start:1584 stop:2033 length:450 start_codon:yes stop_codon:yes gene_type:complete